MDSPLHTRIAICVITLYPKWYRGRLQSIKHTDKIRGDLAIEFITKAQNQGYTVVIVDGKSSKSFKKSLSEVPGIILKNRKSQKRSPAKRLAYKIASAIPGVEVIVTTEAEKVSLLDSIDEIVRPILSGSAAIVIPNREEKLFKETYPAFQYDSEVEGNQLYLSYLHIHGLLPESQNLDLFFGPRAFVNEKKVVSLFYSRYSFRVGNHIFNQDYLDPEEISNATFFPIVLALKRKIKIEGVTVQFSYPKLQKENEDVGNRALFEEKRRNQRLGLLVELMQFLLYLEKRKR